MRKFGLLSVLMLTAGVALATPVPSEPPKTPPESAPKLAFPDMRAKFLEHLRAELKLQQALVACVEKAKDPAAGAACIDQRQAKRLTNTEKNPARQTAASDWCARGK